MFKEHEIKETPEINESNNRGDGDGVNEFKEENDKIVKEDNLFLDNTNEKNNEPNESKNETKESTLEKSNEDENIDDIINSFLDELEDEDIEEMVGSAFEDDKLDEVKDENIETDSEIEEDIDSFLDSLEDDDMPEDYDVEEDEEKKVESVYDLKGTEKFRDGAEGAKHIFEGEVKNGKAMGYHHENFPTSKGEIIEETRSRPNEYGAYIAKIKVDGVEKKAKSTFFPADWSSQDVVNAINEAYDSKGDEPYEGNTYIGETKDGMRVAMYLKENGEIISAFPWKEDIIDTAETDKIIDEFIDSLTDEDYEDMFADFPDED